MTTNTSSITVLPRQQLNITAVYVFGSKNKQWPRPVGLIMRLHGICVVKNEGDFIERSLRHNVNVFDYIYVLDNGSEDSTWEIVQNLAQEFPQVIAFKRDPCVFHLGLRGDVFRAHKDSGQVGDWWCRLDADEIYVDDPRLFLASVPSAFHVVWAIHLQYYFTEVDQARWSQGEPEQLNDFSDLPSHYLANASEARWFRHREGLTWDADSAWPRHMGLVYPERLRLKHFQWRNPRQMQVRLNTRHEAVNRGYSNFQHIVAQDWKDTIAQSSNLNFDDQSGRFVVDEAELPKHMERPFHRLVKRFMHGSGIWP